MYPVLINKAFHNKGSFNPVRSVIFDEQFNSVSHSANVYRWIQLMGELYAPKLQLAARGICVRAGFHCCPLGHAKLGTEASGAVRASFGPFNTHPHVRALASALRKISASAEDLPLPARGLMSAAGPLMIAAPFPCDGRRFVTHPPMAERIRRLESLAGYPKLRSLS